jgi:hypothetical protein
LLKNSHLAAILERPFVRRSAATPLQGICGCDDPTIFEQPEFFNSLLDVTIEEGASRSRNIEPFRKSTGESAALLPARATGFVGNRLPKHFAVTLE